MKKVRELLTFGTDELKPFSGTSNLDARVLLQEAAGISGVQIIADPETLLEPEAITRYQKFIERRRVGEPVAYITGRREFYGREFLVDDSVLVPRPETELIIERALLRLKDLGIKEPRILDLGTGSGCIAITIALEAKKLGLSPTVLAIDKSEAALEMARINSIKLGSARLVTFRLSDWFSNVRRDERFDLILANPPYIAKLDPQVSPETRFEPKDALYAGTDGLASIEILLLGAKNSLSEVGSFIFEIGHDQAPKITSFIENNSKLFSGIQIQVHKDLSGHDRVFETLFASA